jgi:hypothetical protein
MRYFMGFSVAWREDRRGGAGCHPRCVSFRTVSGEAGSRDPESSKWFAEGGRIDIVAFSEPLRWIPDSIPLRCMLPG